jgi:hypothetical protein
MNSTQLDEPFPLLLLINITTLLFGCIGILASLLFISIILSKRTLRTLANILMLNSTLGILFLSADTLAIAGYVLYRDLQRRQLQTLVPMKNMFLCHLRGYIAHVSFGALVYSYAIQTFNRLVGTIFFHRVSFQRKKIYHHAIGLQWLFSVVQTLPIALGNNQIFIEHEYLCQIAIDNSKAIGYLCLTNYLIPLTGITIMYAKIAEAVRTRQNNGEWSRLINSLADLWPLLGNHRYNVHRVRRQLVLTRRILILIAVLLILGGPYSTFIMMELFSIGRAPSYCHRIGFMFIAIAAAVSIFTIIHFTRPTRQMVIRFSRQWNGRHSLANLLREEARLHT